MARAGRVCPTPGCPKVTTGGRCDTHRRQADHARGTARQRGYDHTHERRFRRAVLDRDPTCTRCHRAPSAHADHHPLSRRELVVRGLDPNDPRHGRGLCQPCHSRETAADPAQRGGWHAR
ncbi:holin [Saccharomonospora piscinae]|uniref:Holin n=1 Tax=Saccharomonospora piscinae TaxID=687388 RepID=A0A1V8ZYB9_SACPI|nr:holin [Saccharomonospora piscinae]